MRRGSAVDDVFARWAQAMLGRKSTRQRLRRELSHLRRRPIRAAIRKAGR